MKIPSLSGPFLRGHHDRWYIVWSRSEEIYKSLGLCWSHPYSHGHYLSPTLNIGMNSPGYGHRVSKTTLYLIGCIPGRAQS